MQQDSGEKNVAGVDRLADRAHEAVDVAHEHVKRVAASASDLADEAGERISSARTSVGTMLRSAANRLRQPRAEGRTFAPRQSVADQLDRAGVYLEKQSAGQLRADVEELVRTRPLQALFLSLTAGYMLARTLRR